MHACVIFHHLFSQDGTMSTGLGSLCSGHRMGSLGSGYRMGSFGSGHRMGSFGSGHGLKSLGSLGSEPDELLTDMQLELKEQLHQKDITIQNVMDLQNKPAAAAQQQTKWQTEQHELQVQGMESL